MSAAMVVANGGPAIAKASDPTRVFEPRDIDEGFELAKLLVASGLMPRGVQRAEAAFAIIAAGRELGLTAMQSLRSIHIIEGKPTLSADLIAALCKSRSDVCQYFRLVESTDKIARYETLRKGEPEPTSMTWTWDDATRAGVTSKDNWKKYPAAMLRARCITALARAVYPDLAMGVYDPDEVHEVVDATIVQTSPSNGAGGGQRPPSARGATPTTGGIGPAPRAEVVDENGPTFRKLCDRIDAAETAQALNGVAAASKKAHDAGQITEGNFQALKDAVTRKRGLIGAPKPPPSEPKVAPSPSHDDDGMYDDEADAMAAAGAPGFEQ
jgi:hypothetical protein